MQGVRADWADSAGKPHPTAIELNVVVMNRNDPEVQVRGVVDVPSPPLNDPERRCVAAILLRAAMPDSPNRDFVVADWKDANGGSGIRVRSCRSINETPVTDRRVCGRISVRVPPEIEEPEVAIGAGQRDHWSREYAANPYCRFETRQDLNQRFQDLLVNTIVLKRSGKMGFTHDARWHRLLHCAVEELSRRGQPPHDGNLDPRVERARSFQDGELCRKSAEIVAARATDHDVLVKYGKFEHMKNLYEDGVVYMNTANEYNRSTHNQAVRDDERAIVFKGGYLNRSCPGSFYADDTVPPAIEDLADEDGVDFSTIFESPTLERNEYAEVKVEMLTDYWMFCTADVLDQRLFADFDADSCVVIRKRPFVDRLLSAAKFQLPNVNGFFGHVDYVDPLGASPRNRAAPRPGHSMPIHMSKVLRYAYQREARFACVPRRFQEHLKPKPLTMGSISDIAEFVVL